MPKLILLVERKAGSSHDEFRAHYESVHAPLAKRSLPHLCSYARNYLTSFPGKELPPFDCITEFWFKDDSGLRSSLDWASSEDGQVLARDEANFMARETMRTYLADEVDTGVEDVNLNLAKDGNGAVQKLVLLVKRRSDLSREDFREHYESVHVPLAKQGIPNLVRYIRNYLQSFPGQPEPAYDCLTELWFSDRDGLAEALSWMRSEDGQLLAQDEPKFMNREAMAVFMADEVHSGTSNTVQTDSETVGEAKCTFAFDHHSPVYKETWAESAQERAEKCPLAWTDAHGGYWVLSSHAGLSAAVNDHETFSSSHNSPDKPWAKGILIPELPYTLSLSESDPPIHQARRMIEAPYFAPQAVRRLSQVAQRHIDEAIAEVIYKGEFDLAADFAMRVAAKTTMEVVGIDPELWRTFMMSAHQASLLPTDHPDYPIEAIKFVQSKMREVLAERKENPRQDIASALATKTAMGEPLELEVQVGMMSAAIFGGFGTVMSTTLSALMWLENRHDIRPQLLSDDPFIDHFVEEILRVYPPNHGTARTVGRDVEMHGQKLRKGDRILFSWVAANRDPNLFECPAEVRPDRANAKEHFSFGGGHHKCLGAPLARVEVRQMIRAVLTNMPDYTIDHDQVEYYPSFANTAGVLRMPVRFTPKASQ